MILITGQIPEEVYYHGARYELTGVNGKGLYIPDDFGIKSYWKTTACYRGFQMRYKVYSNELILDQMSVNTKHIPPPINGVYPQKIYRKYASFDYIYIKLNLKSKFTGWIMIGKDFIKSMYVHMGFQKPKTFKKLLELHVDNGNILEVKDRSNYAEMMRKLDKISPKSRYSMDFIKDSFSLDY
ncbi:MAG: hypothetical protein ACFE8V_13760 [Promethearchaeota archaeon]